MASNSGSVGNIQAGASASDPKSTKSVLGDVDMDMFLKLLIAELENQDPLKPLDNSEILEQVSQIREVESNTRLTETLQAVLLGQSMATAAGMIGQWIEGLADSGDRVTGPVQRVSVIDGEPKLIVGEYQIDLKNVAEIRAKPPSVSEDQS